MISMECSCHAQRTWEVVIAIPTKLEVVIVHSYLGNSELRR